MAICIDILVAEKLAASHLPLDDPCLDFHRGLNSWSTVCLGIVIVFDKKSWLLSNFLPYNSYYVFDKFGLIRQLSANFKTLAWLFFFTLFGDDQFVVFLNNNLMSCRTQVRSLLPILKQLIWLLIFLKIKSCVEKPGTSTLIIDIEFKV